MKYYSECWRKCVVFSGRARRAEYWTFYLCNAFVIIDLRIFAIVAAMYKIIGRPGVAILGLLEVLYSLATILPGLAVTVRRLHDTGRSGWWVLLFVVPSALLVLFAFMCQDSWWVLFCVASVMLVPLVFMCQNSQPGENKYGSNPKE